MADPIQGKTALVTGSSQGIGKAIAKELAKQGCFVLINCAHNRDKAQGVCEEIRASGGKAEGFLCDVSKEEELREKLKSVPPVDILVNNARLDPYKRPEGISDGDWFNRLLQVNLTGAYLAILAVSEGMKERRWGRIINVSSVQAHIAVPPHLIPYAVSKLGLHALTRCFALELGKYNITVNTVAPGMVVTENIYNRLTHEQVEQKLGNFPLHRAAESEEVAECVVNTLRCGAMTGETVNINSGIYFPA